MFPERLAEAIKRRRIKKSDLARAVGITPGNLSRYLNGRVVPDKPVLLLLAQQLQVSMDYLLGTSNMAQLADPPVFLETESEYLPDAVALTGLDVEERRTILRMLDALRSGDAEIRRHLIGQLKIIETALISRRQQSRVERKDEA